MCAYYNFAKILGNINVSYPIIIGENVRGCKCISSVRNHQSVPFSFIRFMYVPEELSPKLSAAFEIITSDKNLRDCNVFPKIITVKSLEQGWEKIQNF